MTGKTINRIELWVAVIGLTLTIIAGYGQLTGKLGSMQSSINDLKTSQQNEITLVNGLILKPSTHAEVNQPLSTNAN